ncbi:MAG: 4Fe-4S binding protein [Paramuribaculum sp.]|nr:4Fe-4S binding protein [Paramuribaculum sp.]
MNQLLKISRIAVSLLILLVITGALTAVPLTIHPLAEWIERIQFLPAVITFSLAVFVGWLIITLIFGRIYCSTVCPLGTVMDICAKTRLKISPQVYRYSYSALRIRYLVLLIVLICLMAGFFTIPSVIDPYTAYARICRELISPVYSRITGTDIQSVLNWSDSLAAKAMAGWAGASIAVITLLIVAVMATKKGRILCNTVCPVGTTLGFISRFSIFQIDIDTDKCINCRKCEYVCKSCCIDLNDHVVDGSRCVNCFNCINVCPNDAIHYTFRRKQLSIPMMRGVKPILPEPTLENSAPRHNCNQPDNNSNDETIS